MTFVGAAYLAVVAASYAEAHPGDQMCGLPHAFPLTPERSSPTSWTVRDLVQMREIGDAFGLEESVSLSNDGNSVAFILRQGCIQSGRLRYGLFIGRLDRPGRARLVAQGPFMADLVRQPNSDGWTFRSDFGHGVQLYRISASTQPSELVATPPLLRWGAEVSAFGPPVEAGILSYGWAPDGSGLWYATAKVRAERSRGNGIVYDLATMTARDALNTTEQVQGVELRYRSSSGAIDRSIATVSGGGPTSWYHIFNRVYSPVRWIGPTVLLFKKSAINVDENGNWPMPWIVANVSTGHLDQYDEKLPPEVWRAAHLGMTISPVAEQSHLQEQDQQGGVMRDFGPVQFKALGRNFSQEDQGVSGPQVYVADFGDHDGVVSVSRDGRENELEAPGNLRQCSFYAGRGICVFESLTGPPRLVSVNMHDHEIRPFLQFNPEIAAISPLRYSKETWTNRFGKVSTGYVLRPRHFVRGRRYPTIVVSHGEDARDQFGLGRLWDFPSFVLAENGYLVILANESEGSQEQVGKLFAPDKSTDDNEGQFWTVQNAVASMKAAVQSQESAGSADASAVAIAGWSRGAEVVGYSIATSGLFRAGIAADGFIGADQYWMTGSNLMTKVLKSLYAGSVLDTSSDVQKNYGSFELAKRASKVSAPLLLISSEQGAVINHMEPLRFLSEAKVPVESVFYPNEGHAFWNPRHRASVMNRTIAWVDFWLRARAPSDRDSRQRWQRMRQSFIGRNEVQH